MDPDPLPFGTPAPGGRPSDDAGGAPDRADGAGGRTPPASPGPAPIGSPPTEDTEPPPGTTPPGPTGSVGSSGPARSFQAASGIQGRQFAEQCDTLLAHLGFELLGRRVLGEVGVEIDQEARGPGGTTVWFEYKGSIQGNRPGLRRTDTLKKAIANGALLRAVPDVAPYVVVTSHLPEAGSGAAMLRAALDLGYLADVVCLYDPAATRRLGRW